MAILHAKFLWEIVTTVVDELITPRLNGIKLLATSIIGLTVIPHLTSWHLSPFAYYFCAFVYYCCIYTFAIEASHFVMSILTYHRLYFCCGGH